MKCDCIHKDICQYRKHIEGDLAQLVPNIANGWEIDTTYFDKVAKLITSFCRYRMPIPDTVEYRDGTTEVVDAKD